MADCGTCGVSLGARDWHIEVWDEGIGKWRILYGSVGNRSWVGGLYAGITDFTRCGDQLRLLNHKGEAVREQMAGSGIQVGMTIIPHKKRFSKT